MTYTIAGAYDFPKSKSTPHQNGTRILMMPFIQGDPDSLPEGLDDYHGFVGEFCLDQGSIGFLTIDDSYVSAGGSQRGYGKSDRTLHTEACAHGRWTSWKTMCAGWGGGSSWGSYAPVMLDDDLQVLIGNSIDRTCAVWDAEETPTIDGDLGHVAHKYPRAESHVMAAGEIVQMGIRTPHECIPQLKSSGRQFIRIVGSGVHGRAPHFTKNPKLGDES